MTSTAEHPVAAFVLVLTLNGCTEDGVMRDLTSDASDDECTHRTVEGCEADSVCSTVKGAHFNDSKGCFVERPAACVRHYEGCATVAGCRRDPDGDLWYFSTECHIETASGWVEEDLESCSEGQPSCID